jgi:hypothetical protein
MLNGAGEGNRTLVIIHYGGLAFELCGAAESLGDWISLKSHARA